MKGGDPQLAIRPVRHTPYMSPPVTRSLLPLTLGLGAVLGMAMGIRVTLHSTRPTVSPAAAASSLLVPPEFARQWNMQQIDLQGAWAISSGAPVTVAVLDTGFVQSEKLTNAGGTSREVNGYDFVSDPARSGDGDGRDPDGSGVGQFAFHAETVANLIAAGREGPGVVGVNPQAQIVHVRVAGTDGLIAPQDLADAVRWASGLTVPGAPINPHPARILNLSLFADFVPLTGCDARVNDAIQAVTARGTLVVAGAGNDDADAAGYSPAGCANVLTVTAVDRFGRRPAYANWGRTVALAAPGGTESDNVPLWSQGTLLLRNGTSFATPLVTGVASLMLGINPTLTPSALIRMLKVSATPFPGGYCDPVNTLRTCGAGVLNAGAAVKLAAGK